MSGYQGHEKDQIIPVPSVTEHQRSTVNQHNINWEPRTDRSCSAAKMTWHCNTRQGVTSIYVQYRVMGDKNLPLKQVFRKRISGRLGVHWPLQFSSALPETTLTSHYAEMSNYKYSTMQLELTSEYFIDGWLKVWQGWSKNRATSDTGVKQSSAAGTNGIYFPSKKRHPLFSCLYRNSYKHTLFYGLLFLSLPSLGVIQRLCLPLHLSALLAFFSVVIQIHLAKDVL